MKQQLIITLTSMALGFMMFHLGRASGEINCPRCKEAKTVQYIPECPADTNLSFVW
jgi:hypothetical protein